LFRKLKFLLDFGQKFTIFDANSTQKLQMRCVFVTSEPAPNSRFPLYNPRFEHDACGVGFVADISGKKSHKILELAIKAVCNLTHRGAVDADAQTGDGAGVLTQIPHKFFLRELSKTGGELAEPTDLGVGMLFLPREDAYQNTLCRAIVEGVIQKRGIKFLGWRPVPVNAAVLGDKAAATRPDIEQVFVARPENCPPENWERLLYLARRQMEQYATEYGVKNFYIASFSNRTIVYKGLMIATALPKFYKDLQSADYETALAVYHQRYSTNTFPTWPLAHPFRMLAHNGEINTIQGNRNWTRAREAELESPLWGEDIEILKPIIQPGGSDSANMDNALEALTLSGRNILHAVMMLAPEAWKAIPNIEPDLRGFYEYHECLNESWDGPAAIIFSDGAIVGATLDRNGLRPARYKITSDGLIIMGSEVGILEVPDSKVVEKGRLGPGEMIAVDTVNCELLKNRDIKWRIARQKPYAEWVEKNLYRLNERVKPPEKLEISPLEPVEMVRQQICFGYSAEEFNLIFKPMVENAKEPVGSMGDDTALSCLSRQPRLLCTYFKQLFAQVTNPPIDPIREKLVMSLVTDLGHRRNWFGETPEHAKQVQLSSPVLWDWQLDALRKIDDPQFKTDTISILFRADEGEDGMLRKLNEICMRAENAADTGKFCVILTDRGVNSEMAPVPILLAVGAAQNHLLRVGKRTRLSIVADTGEPREIHHFATLYGYGANAICPYLAIKTIQEIVERGDVKGLTLEKALENFRKAIEDGTLKIMSKMGICTLGSYRGAQIFEALGLSEEVIDRCFTNTPSRIGGLGFREIARETLTRHSRAYKSDADAQLQDLGYYRFRKGGELHAWSPESLRAMQAFRKSAKFDDYKHLSHALNVHEPLQIKDLLRFKSQNPPIPIDEVEPIEEIRRRFTTAGMSLGALSPEAHETLAIAMNRIGGKSNSGEGGEDPTRFHVRPNGDNANSAIKQVASGRFGLTAEYLASAKELEIKMAQGSKPGEGGQLPGHKVSTLIARLRHSVPGVTLISPPPHHDIYSIEDLAQLIYDLKQANPRAKVCVKLVSEAGVGTIAAGVAKAHADIILISGDAGGTGASPLSSIKNAGTPWELGIGEAQQILVMNGLRDRVTLRTDGGFKTGRDIVIAAMLGAEEYNFGTAALIAVGCRYVRQCHLNTCPVGVATQDEKLRLKFEGNPDQLVNYFNAVAQEVREILAQLGVRSLNEIIGRTEFLEQIKDFDHPKANLIDLGLLLSPAEPIGNGSRLCTAERNDRPDKPLDDAILQDCKDALRNKTPIKLEYKIRNTNRTVGGKLAGEIAYRFGDAGLPQGTIELHFKGSAGQSFGAWCVNGMRLILEGEANDYVGKGMSGGEIVVHPPKTAKFKADENVVIGNTVMYGATGGALYAAGRAGERFCVRNSGGQAVVEGVGDHGCEYMTNGIVVILGSVGRNFAAGMTGGVAFVLDEVGDFKTKYNAQLVQLEPLVAQEDVLAVQSMIYRHLELTNSEKARRILADWKQLQSKFWKVVPHPPEVKTKEPAKTPAMVSEDVIATSAGA
jgi:glutamate synthase domain-containing protein 2/glutamate synthase domain-containing protein 1/glutamate synthase domain-containing protein 3